MAASAIVTFLPALRASGVVVAEVARRGLVLTLFLVGLGIRRGALKEVGIRPLIQGVLLGLFVGAGSLAAIATGLATP